VVGQWDPTKVTPLAKQKLWITVSPGDAKAYPYENQITKILAQDGASVSTATWNGKAGSATLDSDARALAAKGSSINYDKGTVIPSGADDNATNEHLCTWRIAGLRS
jgi:predicted peptidase